MNDNGVFLDVEDLKTYFPVKRGLLRRTVGYVKAVDGVSFGIGRGQTLGLVGESGCGKTTVARSLIRLVPATAGRVKFDGIDVLSADKNQLRQVRRQISLVFQDPFGSLNPRMTVGDIIGEPLKIERGMAGSELVERVEELLLKVGLSAGHINRYPHEFSGGQRQRIGVARALALEPKLVICDEPVSALDVSIQSQILNLLKDLQDELSLAYLFIAHDLAVVEFFCDVVAVMYMGKIVEQARAEELYRNPLHPYTCALLRAIPQVEAVGSGKRVVRAVNEEPSNGYGSATGSGEVPSIFSAPVGCAFGSRCPLAEGDCLKRKPILAEKRRYRGHFVACWKCREKNDYR